MARPQLVGKKVFTTTSLDAATVSLTDLTGGLASQPSEDDVILVSLGVTSSGDQTLTIQDGSSDPYEPIGAELYVDASADTNMLTAYKVAGSTPDTSVFVDTSGSGNAAVVLIEVWRGVDPGTVLDISAQTVTGLGTARANPPSISPATADAVVVAFGFGSKYSFGGSISDFTSSDLSGFQSDTADATYLDIAGGSGHYDWVSGSFNPAQFGGGDTSTGTTWAALTLALRPAVTEQEIEPPLLVNTQTFFSPALTPGAVALIAPLLVNEQTFFAPTISAVNELIVPLLVNEQQFFAPTLSLGGVVAPPLLVNEQVFYPPTLTPGPVTIATPLLVNEQVFFSPAITARNTLEAPLLVNTQTFYAPLLAIVVPAITPASRRLNLPVARLAGRRAALATSRLAQRRLELN